MRFLLNTILGSSFTTGISSLRVSLYYEYLFITGISLLRVSLYYGHLFITSISLLRASIYYEYLFITSISLLRTSLSPGHTLSLRHTTYPGYLSAPSPGGIPTSRCLEMRSRIIARWFSMTMIFWLSSLRAWLPSSDTVAVRLQLVTRCQYTAVFS